MDDAQLVQAARSGDRDAFAAIYDRYADRLHAYLFTILRDRDEAADALHDAFMDAGARLHQLRDPGKLRPWLFAIARHRAFRRIRERDRVEPVEEIEMTAAGHDPSEGAGAGEIQELIAAAAEGLSERDRGLLELHLREGLEGEELGQAMGVTASHAYVLMNRLRGQLERSLGALLVARQGSRDCRELASILEGWDGRFTPLVRKRVARHVDGCEECGAQRSRLFNPAALLSAMPFLPAPAELRDRVLGDVELVSHQGRPWSGRRDGFPPPDRVARQRAGRRLAVAALLLLLLGGLWAFGPGGDDGPGVEGVPIEEEAPVTTTDPPAPPTTTTVPEGDAPEPTAPGRSSRTGATPTSVVAPGDDSAESSTTSSTSSSSTTTTTQRPTTTTAREDPTTTTTGPRLRQ